MDFTPHSHYSWDNRFDDIQRRFRSTYVAADRLTCFREVLHVYRPDTEALADFEEIFHTRPQIVAGEVTYSFRRDRVLIPVRLNLVSGELVDLDNVALRHRLERQHAKLLARHGIPHLDIEVIRGGNREVTQTLARTLFDDGAAGVQFRSKLDDQTCVALFEGRAVLLPIGDPEPLTHPISELLQVCSEFCLVLRDIH